MNRNELKKKSFFDLVVDNAKNKTQEAATTPTDSTPKEKPKAPNIFTILGFISAPFIFALLLKIGLNTILNKFHLLPFTYWETLNVFIGLWAIGRILKLK
jgi:hypothetical protein